MIKNVLEDYKLLLRSIPASTVTCFIVSVILMNLLANKELISSRGSRSTADAPSRGCRSSAWT